MIHEIKTILIDDEAGALKILSGMLGEFCPQINIVAQVKSIKSAFAAILRYQPDVVFLDIEISPNSQGFDLLTMIPQRDFGVVFCSAHQQYAIRAINDVQPWGFLLKPYRVNELVKLIGTIQEKVKSIRKKGIAVLANTYSQRLMISHKNKGHSIIRIDRILYCQADQNVTHIYYQDRQKLNKITAPQLLSEIEMELPKELFFRTHHSYLVNLSQIRRYRKTGRNGQIFLPYDCQVAISVAKMKVFELAFQGLVRGWD